MNSRETFYQRLRDEQPVERIAVMKGQRGHRDEMRVGNRHGERVGRVASGDGDARQQHLVGDQPGRSSINQGAGPIVAAPAKGVEPSGQPETCHRVVAKVREAAVRPDEREVPDASASRKIGVHVRAGFKSELFDHGRQGREQFIVEHQFS